MKRYITALTVITISSLTALPNVYAADGKDIYSKNCTGCHGTEVFTRLDHKVKNKAKLKNRVKQCSYAIEAKWFDEEIMSVTDYLNKEFYKF